MLNIDKLINFLKAEETFFSMHEWKRSVHKDDLLYYDQTVKEWAEDAGLSQDEKALEILSEDGCGTVACIGGSASHIASEDINLDGGYDEIMDWIMDGVPSSSQPEASELFEPDFEHASWLAAHGSKNHITRDRAIRVLENLRNTGDLDWTIE